MVLVQVGNQRINAKADSGEISIDFIIGKTNNGQSVLFNGRRPRLVIVDPFFAVVLRAIQFNDKFCSMAIKISNVVSYGALTIKFDGIKAQKLIP